MPKAPLLGAQQGQRVTAGHEHGAQVHETQTWVLGDAHPHNFGTFTVAGGDVVYGLNDFDEATVGPFKWDVRRAVVGFDKLEPTPWELLDYEKYAALQVQPSYNENRPPMLNSMMATMKLQK